MKGVDQHHRDLRVRATKVGSETVLAQIVAMVQEAQNSKAPGGWPNRAAFWLVLVALIGGTVTFLVWMGRRGRSQTALLFAITVVVITCPDALGLATPTASWWAPDSGPNAGVLFKTPLRWGTAARIDTVVMDKTGTLTKGGRKSPTSSPGASVVSCWAWLPRWRRNPSTLWRQRLWATPPKGALLQRR